MNSTSTYISLMLISVSIVMVACTVLVNLPEGGNDLIIGKRCWFHLSLLAMGGSTLFAALFSKREMTFTFSITDVWMFVLFVFCGAMYNWDTTDPAKFAFAFQLLVLWFMLRIGLSIFPELSPFLMSILLCIGCVEALSGIVQRFGLTGDEHFLAHFTGSFINKTSYGGYLATLFPVSLCWALRYGTCKKRQWWRIKTLLFYAALPALVTIMLILPAVIDRVTWLAVVIPCSWIAWRCFHLGHILKHMKLRHSVAFTYAGIFLAVTAFITISGLCVSHPFEGNLALQYHPTFSLHPADALAQADLTGFTKITHSPHLPYRNTEINVFLLLLFLSLQGSCFYLAYKKRLIDVCGALLAATIFMVFSFSLVRPPFLITLVLISVLSNLHSTPPQPVRIHYGGKIYTLCRSHWTPAALRLGKGGIVLLALSLLVIAHSLFLSQPDAYQHYRHWVKQTSEMNYDWKITVE